MIRSVAGKALGLGRATVVPVVLAVMLIVVFGATPASAHGGYKGLLHLGHSKAVAKVTTLVGQVATGSSLVVSNPSGGSALGLQVNAGRAPMTVNAEAGKATNLDADKVDGYGANELVRVARANASGTTLTGTEQNQVTVSLTAPTAGFVLVQSDYNVSGTGCPCEAWMLLRDEGSQTAPSYKIVKKAVDHGFDSGSMGWVFPVTAGSHTFRLTAFKGGGTTVGVNGPTIQALFVPFGSAGGAGTLQAQSLQEDSPTSTR